MTHLSYELVRCVVCGGSRSDIVATHDDIRREVEALWEFHSHRNNGAPLARLADRAIFSEQLAFRLVQCRDCGLVFRNPRERSIDLEAVYSNGRPSPQVLRALHDAQRPAVAGEARRVRRLLPRGSVGLEVGSYSGAFLVAARDEGLQFEGLDVNSTVIEFGRSLGFPMHRGDLTSFTTDRQYDAVVIWNTFDQLAEPRESLTAAKLLLRPGGLLALRVANGELYARLRSKLSSRGRFSRAVARQVLTQNNLLTFPYQFGFTRRSLRRLVDAEGFRTVRMRGDALVPTTDRWTSWWARAEERLLKSLCRGAARVSLRWAPWLELYARRE